MGIPTDAPERALTPRLARLVVPVTTLLLAVTAAPTLAVDSDGDGLRDGWEKRYGVTSPYQRDTDGDGVIDGAEDLDGDWLSNLGEQRWRTKPHVKDSDGDRKSDGREDTNRNGISNAKEQDRRRLPAGLRPALRRAKRDAPRQRGECMTRIPYPTVLPCPVGPEGAGTTIALIGDSHALMWLPAFERAATDADWRVTGYFKGGCPLAVGLDTQAQYEADRGRTCDRWRNRVLGRLRDKPPDLIVITHFVRYKLVTARGKRVRESGWPWRWKAALQRTIDRLPPSSRVVLLGDVPRNFGKPIECLQARKYDISSCVSPYRSPEKRPVEQAMRAAAESRGVKFRTLYGKVCTYRPCPLVQGQVLMWRDTTHLTKTFAKLLAPSVRSVVEDLMTAPARARR